MISRIAASLFALLLLAQTALGCTCLRRTFCEHVKAAEWMVQGRVEEAIGSATDPFADKQYRVRIQRVFIAPTGAPSSGQTTTISTASSTAACGYPLQTGEVYLLDLTSTGRVSLCSATKPWSDVTPDEKATLRQGKSCGGTVVGPRCGDSCGGAVFNPRWGIRAEAAKLGFSGSNSSNSWRGSSSSLFLPHSNSRPASSSSLFLPHSNSRRASTRAPAPPPRSTPSLLSCLTLHCLTAAAPRAQVPVTALLAATSPSRPSRPLLLRWRVSLLAGGDDVLGITARKEPVEPSPILSHLLYPMHLTLSPPMLSPSSFPRLEHCRHSTLTCTVRCASKTSCHALETHALQPRFEY